MPPAHRTSTNALRADRLAYTDHPCPGGNGELIHQADDSEVIDQYLRLGQDALAKQYADSHHLDALYQQRLAAHQQRWTNDAQRQADEATPRNSATSRRASRRWPTKPPNATGCRPKTRRCASRTTTYRDQLRQPVYNAATAYWGVVPPYGNATPRPSPATATARKRAGLHTVQAAGRWPRGMLKG